MPCTVNLLLQHGCIGCVCHQAGGGVRCGVGEKGGIGQSFLCGVEGGHGGIRPGEGLGLGLACGEEGMEWLHEVGAVGKKAVVEVHEAYEPAELTLGLRLGEIMNGLDLFGKGRDAMAVDMMTEEVQLRDAEEAFIGMMTIP